MKQFLLKFLLIFTIVACCWWTLTALTAEDSGKYHKLERLWSLAPEVEVLNIGTSQSSAIDFETLGMNGYDLFRGFGNYYMTEYILNSVIDSLPKLDWVLLSVHYVMPHSFPSQENYKYRFYHEYPDCPPMPGDLMGFLKARLIQLNYTPSAVFIPTIFKKKGKRVSNNKKSWRKQDMSKWTAEQIAHAIANRSTIYNDMLQASLKKHPTLYDDAEQSLVRIVKRVQAKGAKLVIFVPPNYGTFDETIPKKEWDKQLAMLQKVCAAYNVPFANFQGDSRMNANKAWFANPDHINDTGAKAFTTLLMEKLGL